MRCIRPRHSWISTSTRSPRRRKIIARRSRPFLRNASRNLPDARAMKMPAATAADIPALKSLLRRSWLATWAPELAFETVQRFAALDPAGQYAQDKWREFVVLENEGALL